MAYYNIHNSAFFLIALVLFSTGNPLVNGLLGLGPILSPILSPLLGPILGPISPPPVTLPPGIVPPVTLPPVGLVPPVSLPPVTLPPVGLVPPVSLPPLTPTPGLPTLPSTNGTIVTGSLCCTPTGTCPASGGTPLAGVLVSVNCTSILGANVLVGQNTTGTNGTFNISITNIVGVIPGPMSPFPCIVTAQLPLNQTVCPIISTVNGILLGLLGSITTVVSNVLGLLLSVGISGFVGL